MYRQYKKIPSIKKYAIHNSVYKNQLENAKIKIRFLKAKIKQLEGEIVDIMNKIYACENDKTEIYDLLRVERRKNDSLILLGKKEHQLQGDIRLLARKKRQVMKEITEIEQRLNN